MKKSARAGVVLLLAPIAPPESISINNAPQPWTNPLPEAWTGHRSVYTLFFGYYKGLTLLLIPRPKIVLKLLGAGPIRGEYFRFIRNEILKKLPRGACKVGGG